MSRDKQIEEMTSDVCDALEFNFEDLVGVTSVNGKKTTENLFAKGYRKASDVAREIFEELREAMKDWKYVWHKDYYGYGGDAMGYLSECVDHTIAELKKKYESEGEG